MGALLLGRGFEWDGGEVMTEVFEPCENVFFGD